MKKSNVSKKKKTLKKAPSLAKKIMKKNPSKKLKKNMVVFDEASTMPKEIFDKLSAIVKKHGGSMKVLSIPVPGFEPGGVVPPMSQEQREVPGVLPEHISCRSTTVPLTGEQECSVNHPTHYNTGKIEVVEYIEDQKFDYHTGNAIKYISRAPHKGSEIKDLKKAIWYLNRKIKNLEALQTGKPVARPNETSI